MSFAAAIEPLRVANRLVDEELYKWSVVWKDRSPVRSSDGITIMPDFALDAAPKADAVFVCASFGVQDFDDPKVLNFLRRQARFGATVGSIGAGTIVLARAGLFDGYRCTIHWENKPALMERFPALEVTSNIYEIDRSRMSCGGGAAALDMMLNLVALEQSVDLAISISSQLLHDQVRTPYDHQRMSEKLRLGRTSPQLAAAISLMEENIDSPLPITAVASKVGLVQRQLERLFRQHCSKTPHGYSRELRLQRARALLLPSALSILNIALATGFSSQPHFTDRYRKRFGLTPSAQRKLALEPVD
jgi:transcriptional regulator GlxA family with amidase domain